MKILVTGAGALLGQGIIRALKASSLHSTIVAVDPSPLAVGLYWAEFAYLIPMATSPRYLDRLYKILDEERPDALLAGTDVELAILAGVRETIQTEFGTHVLVSRLEAVQIADDKWLTYEFLRDHGFGYVPSCLPGAHQGLIEQVGFPLIVKPRVGARSVGVKIVRSRTELEHAVESLANAVIQKHVGTEDTEYTAGTLTFDGKCSASIVMRRELRDGNTYRAYVELYPELNIKMRQVAERLGAYGPANFQFRLESGEPRIFEINCRFSGTTPLRVHAGFNEVEMSLRHILHGEPVVQPPIRPMLLLRHWAETLVPPDELLAAPEAIDGAVTDG